jgi:sarcosine oxidase subunit alpha
MFARRAEGAGRPIAFVFEGERIEAREGESVAVALLAAGVSSFRDTAVSGAPRGPYCLMGVCFDCLVVIDGEGNRQACLVEARDGMVVARQQGKREFGR